MVNVTRPDGTVVKGAHTDTAVFGRVLAEDVKVGGKKIAARGAELSDELSGAFPHLTTHHHRAQTTLTGDLVDQEELQGVLSLLNSLGISVIEVVTIPD